jgi:hypothetical protein
MGSPDFTYYPDTGSNFSTLILEAYLEPDTLILEALKEKIELDFNYKKPDY